ncbi:MAG: hypothetical protein KKC01_09605 [Gammaproteobacteria bacterium]|nr:hypothetical protein [Gammaproteobacteria bacterium]
MKNYILINIIKYTFLITITFYSAFVCSQSPYTCVVRETDDDGQEHIVYTKVQNNDLYCANLFIPESAHQFEIQQVSFIDSQTGAVLLQDLTSLVIDSLNAQYNNLSLKGVTSVNNLANLTRVNNPPSTSINTRDNRNIMYFSSTICPPSSGLGFRSCTACKAGISGGLITAYPLSVSGSSECDIFIGDRDYTLPEIDLECTDAFFAPPLLSAVSHEYGHAIGLGHYDKNSSSINRNVNRLIMDPALHCGRENKNENDKLSSLEYTAIDVFYREAFGQQRIEIKSPANNSIFNRSLNSILTFVGIARDTDNNNISNDIRWSSSIDSNLGNGGELTVDLDTLSVGDHVISARVTVSNDSDLGDSEFNVTRDFQMTDSISITIIDSPLIPPPETPSGSLSSDSPCTVQPGNTNCTVILESTHQNIPVSCLWRVTPDAPILKYGCTFNGLNTRTYSWPHASTTRVEQFDLRGHADTPPDTIAAYNSGALLAQTTVTAVSAAPPTGVVTSDSPCTVLSGETKCTVILESTHQNIPVSCLWRVT